MTLRNSRESEIAVPVGISKAAFDTDGLVGGPPDYDSYEWHSGLCKDGKVYTYFDDNGEIIGGAIRFKSGNVLYIGRIFIVPSRFRQGCRLDTPIWNVPQAFIEKFL